jgi:hypothetical protein
MVPEEMTDFYTAAGHKPAADPVEAPAEAPKRHRGRPAKRRIKNG